MCLKRGGIRNDDLGTTLQLFHRWFWERTQGWLPGNTPVKSHSSISWVLLLPILLQLLPAAPTLAWAPQKAPSVEKTSAGSSVPEGLPASLMVGGAEFLSGSLSLTS